MCRIQWIWKLCQHMYNHYWNSKVYCRDCWLQYVMYFQFSRCVMFADNCNRASVQSDSQGGSTRLESDVYDCLVDNAAPYYVTLVDLSWMLYLCLGLWHWWGEWHRPHWRAAWDVCQASSSAVRQWRGRLNGSNILMHSRHYASCWTDWQTNRHAVGLAV